MRRGAWKLLFVLGAGACVVSACASLFGIQGGVLEDASVDAMAGDVLSDAPFDGGYVNPDANYADCGSMARALAVDAGLFVSQFANGTACTLADPCPTITAALMKANPGDTIYVAPGTYTETLEIGASTLATAIEGGWLISDAGWVPQCDNTTAIVQRDPTSSAEWAVHLDNAPAFTLRLLKIINDVPPGADAGASAYGVLANNTALTLDNVTIQVSAGVTGSNGDPGFGQKPNPDCTVPSNGMDGSVGPSGAGGILVATATGFAAGNTVGNGTPGSVGENGTPGGDAGSCLSCVACQLTCAGDAGTCNGAVTSMSCPGSGTSGCGGASGFGGWAAGRGPTRVENPNGGSSVALYVWGKTVAFANVVTLTAGNAGNGGTGGNGASGVMGTPGQAGFPASCQTTVTCGTFAMLGCGFTDEMACTMSGMDDGGFTTVDGGAAGGTGGTGGPGGQGGGGAGGYSYGYYTGSNAQVTGSTPMFQFGMPGTGGQANGPNGASNQHN